MPITDRCVVRLPGESQALLEGAEQLRLGGLHVIRVNSGDEGELELHERAPRTAGESTAHLHTTHDRWGVMMV